MRVAVIGAGVNGVTSAVAIKEAFPNADVTIFSKDFTPNTTGDGSAGLWKPYLCGNTDMEKIMKWSVITFKWMENFWKSELAPEVGVSLVPLYQVSTDPKGYPLPFWSSEVHGMYEFNAEQLDRLNKLNKTKYSGGSIFVTYTLEPKKMLPYLMKKFESMNGKIVERKVTDLKILKKEGYDVVINCSGLGAGELTSDRSVVPYRGQITKVKSPWMFHAFIEDYENGNYIIPNTEATVLGGTRQCNYDTTVSEQDSKFIQQGCERIFPSLNKSQVLERWVGLRPGRSEIRLESEIIRIPGENELLIIHNYGHGGCGVTLCYGCALDVVDILRQQRKIKHLSKL